MTAQNAVKKRVRIISINDEQVTLEVIGEGVQVVVSAIEHSFSGFQGQGVGDVMDVMLSPTLAGGVSDVAYAFSDFACASDG